MEPLVSIYHDGKYPVVCADYRQPPYSLTGEVSVPYLDPSLQPDTIPFEIDGWKDPVADIIQTIQIAAAALDAQGGPRLNLRAVSIR